MTHSVRDLVDAGLAERFEMRFVDLVVGRSQHFAGLLVDDVVREDAAEQIFVRHFERLDLRLPAASARGAR